MYKRQELQLPKDLIIKLDANYNINSQRVEGHNIEYVLVNASIAKAFFEKKNFILSVNATDILNQNISAQRSVYDNVIVDNKTRVIGRYILFRASYKFKGTKKAPKTDELGIEE